MFAYLYFCSVIILKCLPLKRNEKQKTALEMTCLGVQIGNEQHLAVLEAGIDERLGRRTVLATL